MDPLTALSLGLGAASSIPQWLTGRAQDKRADEMASTLERPLMEIPESQKRALGLAENLAEMDRLPGQSAIEGRLDQTTASQIAMIERMGIGGPTAINAASTAYGNQQSQETALGVKAAEMKLKNQYNLEKELGDQAQWEQETWNWNERKPYEAKAEAIQALREGGIRNKNSAWKNLFGMGANFAGSMAGSGDNTSGTSWWNTPIGGGSQTPVPASTGVGVDPSAPGAGVTPSGPEQKRVWEMMWGQ